MKYYLLITMDIGVCRFQNIDSVTCYMNSILAIIQQMPIFTDYLLTIKDDGIVGKLAKLMYESHTRDDDVLIPGSFRKEISKKNSMWGMKEQQDSQEFLNFLLSSIEEEIKEKVIFVPGRIFTMDNCEQRMYDTIQKIHMNIMKQNSMMDEYSIIKKLFSGMIHNTIKCDYCGNISHKYDSFSTLQLNINNCNDIYDCLDEYIKEEQIDSKNIVKCDFCGMKNRAHKKTNLCDMPKILIIHLKRFMVNNYGVVTRKISNLIKYPIELDISKYSEGKYKLFAVNMHHSLGHANNMNYGHYTSIVKNRNNNKWYHYDDDSELEIVEDVLHKNAYMLFYYKIN
jgi:ubiquitin carboxyl-terminal hydrolase 8